MATASPINSRKIFFDVSTVDLLNKAYKWLFKNLSYEEFMDEEIGYYDNEQETLKNIIYKNNCKVCNKTGKAKIENKDFWVECPKCHNKEIDKNIVDRNKKDESDWLKIMKNFKKAQEGDTKAIKRLIEKDSYKFLDLSDKWNIVKVKHI